MRAALPYILVLLALFTAGCIAFIAWELTAGDDREDRPANGSSPDDPDKP